MNQLMFVLDNIIKFLIKHFQSSNLLVLIFKHKNISLFLMKNLNLRNGKVFHNLKLTRTYF